MDFTHQTNNRESRLPVNTIIHSVNEFKMHWHREIELLLVLKGSINVGVGEKSYHLQESDLMLINSHELHSTQRTKDRNIVLAVQIDPNFYNDTFTGFSRLDFNCRSFDKAADKKLIYEEIVTYMAKIVWELNKKEKSYKMKIGSHLYAIGESLLNSCDYTESKENILMQESDVIRLERITNYINENAYRTVTLKEIADKENLNYYYLSHFIKSKLGLSFQEYLNTIRLDNAIKLLLTTNDSIINISNNSGFANVNSFNTIFKDAYNLTPTQLRNKESLIVLENPGKSKSYFDVDREKAFEVLFSYLDKEVSEDIVKEDITVGPTIVVDAKSTGRPLVKNWQKLTTFSRASEGLRANWQRQLHDLQSDIGFEHIRFHGIFMDEMMVYNILEDGSAAYNWTYVNELFDFLIENNLKPFVDLTFMPDDLKRSDETILWWKGNISPPKEMSLWTDLIKAFINHCILRYGEVEVSTWYFEVWNEPEFINVFWAGTQSQYFEFYKETAFAIKSISKYIKVGGPAITHGSVLIGNWLEEFLDYVNINNVPIDFISVHIFQEYIPTEDLIGAQQKLEAGVSPLELMSDFRKIYHNKDHVKNILENLNHIIESHLHNKVELHVTEYNASSEFGNLINDTAYVAAYVTKNAIAAIDLTTSIGYWAFTDLMEEHKLGISHFHGGYGLINKDGLKKAAYNAFELLAKLGDEIVEIGENYIITKSNEDIQILAYNYTHFDELFTIGDISHINNRDRYSVYQAKEELSLSFKIDNLTGDYKATTYSLNRDHGSVYDVWNEMGAPENMSKDEIKYLKSKEKPKTAVTHIEIKENYLHTLNIPVHGIEMVILKKK